jgi:hypothetical protein
VKHLPIPLAATTPTGANDELVDRLRKSGHDWFFVTGVRPDGTRFGYASDRFRPHEPYSGADVGQFLLFDLHSSFTGQGNASESILKWFETFWNNTAKYTFEMIWNVLK